MDPIEIEGTSYFKAEEASTIIDNYKTDMHKFKDEAANLKTKLGEAESKIKDMQIDIETGNEKLKSLGQKDDEIGIVKTTLADAEAKIKRLENDLETKNNAFNELDGKYFEATAVSAVSSELQKLIAPDVLPQAVELARAKIHKKEDGSFQMEGGLNAEEYAKAFAESNPRFALASDIKIGGGMGKDGSGHAGSKSLGDMNQKELNDFRVNHPKEYMAAVKQSGILKE